MAKNPAEIRRGDTLADVSTPFDWSFPYAWPRTPVLASNVVCTSQPLAAQAGLRMLAEGGSAVGRGHRHRDHAHCGGTGLQWHRLGRVRHRLGWSATARAECVRTLTRGVEAGVLRRQPRSRTRLEFGDRARSGFGMDGTAHQIRKTALREALRACDRLRPRRISGLADGGRAVGRTGSTIQGSTRFRRSLPAGRAGTETRRAVHLSRPGGHAGEDRGNERGGVLSRRAGGKTRGTRDDQRWRHARR